MEIAIKNVKLPESLKKSLENIIKKEEYVSCEVNSQEANAPGTSYLSDSYSITIKGKTKQGYKELFLFIKRIIDVGKMESFIHLSQAYAAEAFVYNELGQVFQELQEGAGIPPSDRFKIINSYGESNSEVTILENVAIQGYKCYDRTYKTSLDFAKVALKELAKYHALSFVLKAKRPDYFEKKIKTFEYPFTFSDVWKQNVTHIAELAIRHLREESRKKLEKYLPNYAAKWMGYLLDQTSRCCLCHGDFRVGNLLMKHVGDELQGLFIVDYQAISYGNPLNDILFFLFVDTDQKFRRQHLDQLVEYYYTTFRVFLERFNLDSEDFYPKKEFLDDYRRKLDYGLLTALFFLPFFLADAKSIPELSKQDLKDIDFGVLDEFSERMQGVVDDFVEWGYL